MIYKLGDIYPDWEKLEPLPDGKNFKELQREFKFFDDQLFVVISPNVFTLGEIINIARDDKSYNPLFTNGNEENYKRLEYLALLPKERPLITWENLQKGDVLLAINDPECELEVTERLGDVCFLSAFTKDISRITTVACNLISGLASYYTIKQPSPPRKDIQELSVSEVSKRLGYPVKIIKE